MGLFVWAAIAVAPVAGDTAADSVADTEIAAADPPEVAAESGIASESDESGEADEAPLEPDDVVEYVHRVIEKEGGFLNFIWKFFSNIRGFLQDVLVHMGIWAYVILWSILFCETGLVVMAFLPGDSLLFATGTLAAWGTAKDYPLNLYILLPVLISGPILGDSCNYWIGRLFGHRIMSKEKNRFFKKSHIEKAHAFYDKHGGKAVAIGRFIPLIRTFVPFVAGVGRMEYKRFLSFSVIGSILWINVCVLAGWMFGQNEFVKDHFETIIIAIVMISLMPAIITFLRSRKTGKNDAGPALRSSESEAGTRGRPGAAKPPMRDRIHKKFAIANILAGGVLVVDGIVLFTQPLTAAPFIALPLGLLFAYFGLAVLKGLRRRGEATEKTRKANWTFFILACVAIVGSIVFFVKMM